MDTRRKLDPLAIQTDLKNWQECDDLEFKSAKGGLPKSLWSTYSAFANTDGGVILLGVENDRTVSGISESSLINFKKDFYSLANDRGNISANLVRSEDWEEIVYESKKIVAIRIPRASLQQRPVYVGQNPMTGTYRRSHEGDYHCSEQEVSRMLSDSSSESADNKIKEHFDLSDLDRRSLQEYRQRLASHYPDHAWLSEDDVGFLTKLGGWRVDRGSGLKGPTIAGILMFGSDEAIREAIPHYQVDYREKLSLDPAVRWTDRVTINGTWTANLFQFYLKVIQRLSQDLKLPFQLDENLFRKGESAVHVAIRETLVNAIIHADYRGRGGVVIEKHFDRFEFSNPGLSLVPISQLIDQKARSTVSKCRNENLQRMFQMIGAAEKAGSGIDKIYSGWKSQQWRSPAVSEDAKEDRVRWILPMLSLIPEESLSRLKERFGLKFQKLSPSEVQALVVADTEGFVDNARICQITNSHTTDATKLLRSLVEDGFLFQKNRNRWARYLVNSPHKESDSPHKESDSPHKEGNSLHKEISAEELNLLKNIAAPAREKKRLPPESMRELIKKLCENRYLTRRQLADLLDRDFEGLQRFLSPMVEYKTLRLRYPDKPNRVDQAYSSTAKHPSKYDL